MQLLGERRSRCAVHVSVIIPLTCLEAISSHLQVGGIKILSVRPKKCCLFPLTLPLQVFIQKIPYPKVLSAIPTPNQRKTCRNHTFLTKKILKISFFYQPAFPIFFGPLQETNNFFFRPNPLMVKMLLQIISSAAVILKSKS